MSQPPVKLPEKSLSLVGRLTSLTESRMVRLGSGIAGMAGAWFLPEGWLQNGLLMIGVVALVSSLEEKWKWKILFGVGVFSVAVGIITLAAGPIGLVGLVLGALFFGRAIQLERKG